MEGASKEPNIGELSAELETLSRELQLDHEKLLEMKETLRKKEEEYDNKLEMVEQKRNYLAGLR